MTAIFTSFPGTGRTVVGSYDSSLGRGGRSRNLRPVGGFSDRQAFRVLEDTLKCSYTH